MDVSQGYAIQLWRQHRVLFQNNSLHNMLQKSVLFCLSFQKWAIIEKRVTVMK